MVNRNQWVKHLELADARRRVASGFTPGSGPEQHFDTVLVAATDRATYEDAIGTGKRALVRRGTQSMRSRLNSAIDTGDPQPGLDVDEALALLIAPLVYRHVFADQVVTTEAIDRTFSGFLQLHRAG